MSDEPQFTEEEMEFFLSHGIDVGRRERLAALKAERRAQNPLRRLWRWLKGALR